MNTPKFEFPSAGGMSKTLYGVECMGIKYLVSILNESETNCDFSVDMKFIAEDELVKFKSEYFYSHPEFRFWSKKQ